MLTCTNQFVIYFIRALRDALSKFITTIFGYLIFSEFFILFFYSLYFSYSEYCSLILITEEVIRRLLIED